jgi:hypothetical protein
MTRHRKDRGLRTERVVAAYFADLVEKRKHWSRGWKRYNNVPFDIEVKARSDFQPLEWLRKLTKRAGQRASFRGVRMNGQGEDASEYLAFMRFGDLVQLLANQVTAIFSRIQYN